MTHSTNITRTTPILLGRLTKFRMRTLASPMREPVNGSSLAMLRIVFGAIGVLSMVRILLNGWVRTLYAGPAHHFTYPSLGWVRPPSVGGMYVLVCVVGVAAACIAIGWRFRVAMAVFWIGFAWIEFIDITTYLNHYWFVTLAGTLMLFAPMTNELAPGASRQPVSRGWIWLFRSQIAAVYCFAGLAKLHGDWLLHALPLRLWLPTRSDVPIIGSILDERWAAFAFSWAGAAFDCTIVGFLLWRRTRLVAWMVVIGFHVATWRLFSIGVFPWLMIGATTLFFDPSWPRDLAHRVSRRPGRAVTQIPAGTAPRRFVVPLALAWVGLQVLIPLRHLAIDGDYRWTGEGYRYSWNVLLTERGGSVEFRVTDPVTRATSITDAADLYTPLQWKQMSTDPELIRQAAHLLGRLHTVDGERAEVRVDAFVSLNGRRATRIIDPTVDLADQPWRFGHQPWILPAPTEPAP